MIQRITSSARAIAESAYERLHDVKEQDYKFFGRHLLASYNDCDEERLLDHEGLLNALREAISIAGATILKWSEHSFDGGGLTAVFLLSESHASIHTYPEYRACFVDMFTCGTTCRVEEFDKHLRLYLKTENVNARILTRHQSIED